MPRATNSRCHSAILGETPDPQTATLRDAITEQSRFGLGGEIPILLKPAGKPVVAISGIGTAPAKATVEFYQSRKAEPWEDEGHTQGAGRDLFFR